MKFCPICGTQNQDNYNFCLKCQNPLPAVTAGVPATAPVYQPQPAIQMAQPQATPPMKKSSKPIIIVAVVGVVVVLVLALVLFFFVMSPNNSKLLGKWNLVEYTNTKAIGNINHSGYVEFKTDGSYDSTVRADFTAQSWDQTDVLSPGKWKDTGSGNVELTITALGQTGTLVMNYTITGETLVLSNISWGVVMTFDKQ